MEKIEIKLRDSDILNLKYIVKSLIKKDEIDKSDIQAVIANSVKHYKEYLEDLDKKINN